MTDRFVVTGRGVVLIPGITPIGDERFKVGDPIMLKRPDGTEYASIIVGLEFVDPNPAHQVFVMLRELGKEDVPVGTEVWSVDKR